MGSGSTHLWKLGLLQMVSKPDTERCASEDTRPLNGGGEDCEISLRLERGTKHSL